MSATSGTALAAALVAVALAGAPASAAAPAPKVIPPRVSASVIPARVGSSLAYRFDFEQTGPRGTATTHAAVALTRVASDRVVVTLIPEAGEPTALTGRVATDGTLHLDAPGAERAPAGDADLPQDTPLGGLPGNGSSAGTAGGSRYGEAAGGAGGRRAAQAPELSALAALLAFRATGGTAVPTWNFSAPVGPAVSGAVPLLPLTARATTAGNGSLETITADGHGDVQLAAAGPAASPAPYGSRGSGGTRRRGGGFPGGGGGGFPGGGGQGRYPSREGGQAPAGSGTAGGQTVPATVALRVEATFRDGRLQGARGSQSATLHAGGSDATTTSRWTLTAY